MNEGHSAFWRWNASANEKTGLTFDQAADQVRTGDIFTTHTPVPAGNDMFSQPVLQSSHKGMD